MTIFSLLAIIYRCFAPWWCLFIASHCSLRPYTPAEPSAQRVQRKSYRSFIMKDMKGKVGTIGSGILKDHFEDVEIIDALKSTYLVSDVATSDTNEKACSYWPFTRNESRQLILTNPDERKLHRLTVGLILKLRNGLFRITRRTRLKVIQPPHDTTEGIPLDRRLNTSLIPPNTLCHHFPLDRHRTL